jgi:hypothetical protein
MAGYSGTPLVRKLGVAPSMRLLVVAAPPDYKQLLGDLPTGAALVASTNDRVEAAHVFVTSHAVLRRELVKMRRRLEPAGFVWVSWPKKTSKVPTDVTEDTVRDVALPLGFVDVKVCAVSDIWSGLKLVIRKRERR